MQCPRTAGVALQREEGKAVARLVGSGIWAVCYSGTRQDRRPKTPNVQLRRPSPQYVWSQPFTLAICSRSVCCRQMLQVMTPASLPSLPLTLLASAPCGVSHYSGSDDVPWQLTLRSRLAKLSSSCKSVPGSSAENGPAGSAHG